MIARPNRSSDGTAGALVRIRPARKVELDNYRQQLARLEDSQRAIQAELGRERTRRQETEEKLKIAAGAVKDAAFVPPAL